MPGFDNNFDPEKPLPVDPYSLDVVFGKAISDELSNEARVLREILGMQDLGEAADYFKSMEPEEKTRVAKEILHAVHQNWKE